jgi:hypothetical protein
LRIAEFIKFVIPGLTRNPEGFEKPGFPIKAFGNDKKGLLSY